jgi:hypothetical protein
MRRSPKEKTKGKTSFTQQRYSPLSYLLLPPSSISPVEYSNEDLKKEEESFERAASAGPVLLRRCTRSSCSGSTSGGGVLNGDDGFGVASDLMKWGGRRARGKGQFARFERRETKWQATALDENSPESRNESTSHHRRRLRIGETERRKRTHQLPRHLYSLPHSLRNLCIAHDVVIVLRIDVGELLASRSGEAEAEVEEVKEEQEEEEGCGGNATERGGGKGGRSRSEVMSNGRECACSEELKGVGS